MLKAVAFVVVSLVLVACSCDPSKEVCGVRGAGTGTGVPTPPASPGAGGHGFRGDNPERYYTQFNPDLVAEWASQSCRPVGVFGSTDYFRIHLSFDGTNFEYRSVNYSDSACNNPTGAAVGLGTVAYGIGQRLSSNPSVTEIAFFGGNAAPLGRYNVFRLDGNQLRFGALNQQFNGALPNNSPVSVDESEVYNRR